MDKLSDTMSDLDNIDTDGKATSFEDSNLDDISRELTSLSIIVGTTADDDREGVTCTDVSNSSVIVSDTNSLREDEAVTEEAPRTDSGVIDVTNAEISKLLLKLCTGLELKEDIRLGMCGTEEYWLEPTFSVEMIIVVISDEMTSEIDKDADWANKIVDWSPTEK